MKQHHKVSAAGTAVCALTLLSGLTAPPCHALPQDGAVVGGAATISQPNPTTMNINQTSANAIINWQGYSIGANEAVKYLQPGSSSIALNRVTGVDPSHIYGLLSGNGQVWVINPNGLLVGPGATVQTGGFLASTMNITDENFLSGKYTFTAAPGSQASIVNQGTISIADGGYVVLAAPSVTNSGTIVANLGTVHLASGDTATLTIDNGSLINVAVDGAVAAQALGVTNSGRISAAGGQVVMTAKVAGDIMKSIVNNDGIIEVNSTLDGSGFILLDSGDYGIAANSGTLDASGRNAGEVGGTVKVLGDKVALYAGSTIDVSGDAGGGTVLVGGNFHGAGTEQNASMTYVDKDASIKADALANGNGGQVAVWSDDATRFYGTISAQGGTLGGDGGFAEVSGRHSLTYAGLVNLGATKGTTGTLLLDPDDITIIHAVDAGSDTADNIAATEPFINWDSTAAPSNISDFTINAQLATPANVTVQTSTGSITSAADADITLNGNTLTLQSAADINLDGTYRGTGVLDLNFAGTLDLSAAPTFVGSPTVSATGMGDTSSIKAAGGTWNLSGANQGNVAGLTFSAAGNLIDSGTGIFNMGSNGSVTGTINGGTGGTLNYSSYATPVTLNLAGSGTTGIGGSWSNITTVTGSAADTDTVAGANRSYTLTGVNAGNSSGTSWTSFEKIADSGTGTVSTAGTQSYNLTGLNMGDVTTLLAGGFTGIGNLSSSGAATFNMGSSGSVTGNLNGGTAGNINYGSYSTPVTLDLAGNLTTGIGGSWSNITTVTGSGSAADTVRGLGKTYTLDGSIANRGSSSGVTWSAFENITDIGAGVIKFGTAGSVAGTISAVGGTLDYSGHTTAVNVNLAGSAGSSTGIGGTWSGITSVTGSANSGDTVTGATQTYTLDNTLANKGSNGTVTWSAIENLTDTGSGTFNMGSGGSVSGSINGGSAGNLNYSSYTNPVTFNLGGTAGTSGIGGVWSNIGTVTGNANANTVVGSNKTYTLDNSTANKGSNGSVTWTGFSNITDTGSGTFNMGSGGSVSGILDGGLNGTLNYSGYTNPVTFNLAGTGSSGIGTSWSHITSVVGSSNNDTVSGSGTTYNLTGANAGNSSGIAWTSFEKIADSTAGTVATTGGRTYTLTGANSGNVTTLLPGGYTGIANLTDSGAANFRFAANGAVTGDISAVNGTLDYAAGIVGPVAVDLAAKSGNGIGGSWSGITTLVGSGAADTVGGSNALYTLTAANAGTSGGVSWTSFEKIADSGTGTLATSGGRTYNLTGANSGNVATLLPGGYSGIGTLGDAGAGIFKFAATGTITGDITAVGGTLDYSAGIAGPVAVNLTAKSGSGIGGTWNGITTMTGSGASDTLGGSNSTYTLTAANSGNSGGVFWNSFENLHDTAAGIFRFASGGAVAGGITATGGTLDYSAGFAGPATVDLTGKSGSGIGTVWNGITAVTGSSSSDTVGGNSATYTLTAANAGTSGGISWTSFEKIADSGAGTIATSVGQTYNLTGTNSGNVTTLLPGGYTGIADLVDSGAGTFRFVPGGAITGNITAADGVLDYSGTTGPVAVDLTAKTSSGIGGVWDGITMVTGSGAVDTMGSGNATYNLTAANAGNSGGVFWTSFEKIADSGAGTLVTSGGRTYNLTGANAGNVTTLLPGGYTGIGTLNDSDAGVFKFAAGGAVTGNLTAVGGTLDYSAGIVGPVTVDLTAASGSGIGGTWSGISTVTGSAASDTLSGTHATYNLTGIDAGNSGAVSWTSFENLHDTAAGIFRFAAGGSVSGGITATGGMLDYSAMTGPVTVDLTAQSAPNIGTAWSGITTVGGSASSSDTITGSNQTYNLTGVDAGNNGSLSWSSFENIVGTGGNNSYRGISGSLLSGSISDSGSAATVQGYLQTGGAQTYAGPVTLAGATTMTSSGSGDITFAGTVASDATARDLAVGTAGVITFAGVVGTTPLNSLTINAGGTTHLNGGAVTTSGAAGQTYNNAVVLGIDTILNAGPGAITEGSTGSITTAGLLTTLTGSGQNLVGNGDNAIAFFAATNSSSGDITLANGANPLTIAGINQSGGLNITNSGAVTSTGPLTVSGATSITAVGQPITLTNLANDFGGPVTVAGAATNIADQNDLAVVLNTTGPTTVTAGANLTLSGISTDAVTATAVDKVTLLNPTTSLLSVTGATIVGTMSNPSPLNLTTTSDHDPITVNLTGDLPFLTLEGDIRTQIRSLGLYNGAIVMGSEMDHYNETIDLRAATSSLAVNAERFGTMGMLEHYDGYFNIAPPATGIDYSQAFIAPETEPKLIDR